MVIRCLMFEDYFLYASPMNLGICTCLMVGFHMRKGNVRKSSGV